MNHKGTDLNTLCKVIENEDNVNKLLKNLDKNSIKEIYHVCIEHEKYETCQILFEYLRNDNETNN